MVKREFFTISVKISYSKSVVSRSRNNKFKVKAHRNIKNSFRVSIKSEFFSSLFNTSYFDTIIRRPTNDIPRIVTEFYTINTTSMPSKFYNETFKGPKQDHAIRAATNNKLLTHI